jgi:hypothetical protein
MESSTATQETSSAPNDPDRDTVYVEKFVPPGTPEIEEYNTVNSLADLRACTEDHKRGLSDLVKSRWELPMSKETVYAYGEINGHYARVISLLTRDITDAEQQG